MSVIGKWSKVVVFALEPTFYYFSVIDIMSTMGGYLEYRGECSVPWGIS